VVGIWEMERKKMRRKKGVREYLPYLHVTTVRGVNAEQNQTIVQKLNACRTNPDDCPGVTKTVCLTDK
jgi:hypothetical protein